MNQKLKAREFRTPEDVLQYLMEFLDMRIADYGLVALMSEALRNQPHLLADAPEDVRVILRDPERQLQSMREVKDTLLELLIERRATATVRKVGEEHDRR